MNTNWENQKARCFGIGDCPERAANQRIADRNIAKAEEDLGKELALIEARALKSNTLLPDQKINGLVFFELPRNRKAKDLILRILVGDGVLEFPFTVGHK